MEISRTHVSCGVIQLHDLNYHYGGGLEGTSLNNYDDMVGVLREMTDSRYRASLENGEEDIYDIENIFKHEVVIFSDADHLGYGKRLERIIRNHRLGRVIKMKSLNPNTGNKITTYLWHYNGNKIKEA